jgi:hypothetical protein
LIRAVIVSESELEDELRGTLLVRRNIVRRRAAGVEDVRRAVQEGRVDVVILDGAFPNVVAVAGGLRRDPLTRGLSIAGLGRTDLEPVLFELLDAGVNAILPLPPGADWDDRLMRLSNVPARKVARFPVSFAVGVGRGQGEPFEGWALNLSVHGLLLRSSFRLEVGEDLRLAFELPLGPVRGTGTVVRQASQAGGGVELASRGRWARAIIRTGHPSPPRETTKPIH